MKDETNDPLRVLCFWHTTCTVLHTDYCPSGGEGGGAEGGGCASTGDLSGVKWPDGDLSGAKWPDGDLSGVRWGGGPSGKREW